jgi:hypothetical protein
MSHYRDTLSQHVRLCLLRLLSEATGYEANSSILSDGVKAYGLNVSRDFVETEIVWLDEQGLLKRRELTSKLAIATLSTRGLDVAEGRAHVHGVKRRGPDS